MNHGFMLATVSLVIYTHSLAFKQVHMRRGTVIGAAMSLLTHQPQIIFSNGKVRMCGVRSYWHTHRIEVTSQQLGLLTSPLCPDDRRSCFDICLDINTASR
jgi:hypothetical protein